VVLVLQSNVLDSTDKTDTQIFVAVAHSVKTGPRNFRVSRGPSGAPQK